MRICMLTYSFYESDNRVLRYATTLAQRGDSVDVLALRRIGDEVVVAGRDRHLASARERPLPPAAGRTLGTRVALEAPQSVEAAAVPAAAVPGRQHPLPT